MHFSKYTLIVIFLQLSQVVKVHSISLETAAKIEIVKRLVQAKIEDGLEDSLDRLSRKVLREEFERQSLVRKVALLEKCFQSVLARIFGRGVCIDNIKVSV